MLGWTVQIKLDVNGWMRCEKPRRHLKGDLLVPWGESKGHGEINQSTHIGTYVRIFHCHVIILVSLIVLSEINFLLFPHPQATQCSMLTPCHVRTYVHTCSPCWILQLATHILHVTCCTIALLNNCTNIRTYICTYIGSYVGVLTVRHGVQEIEKPRVTWIWHKYVYS